MRERISEILEGMYQDITSIEDKNGVETRIYVDQVMKEIADYKNALNGDVLVSMQDCYRYVAGKLA
jgi:hypothetical protein